jgi:hypothetical protein
MLKHFEKFKKNLKCVQGNLSVKNLRPKTSEKLSS